MSKKARKPVYSDTETSSWANVPKTLQFFAEAAYKSTGMEIPDPLPAVGGMPVEVRKRIAGMTLMGNPQAENADDLLFFPVVNPFTGKLNEGALRAVISGRGSAAGMPDGVRKSAQDMARQLLESEFGMGENQLRGIDAIMRANAELFDVPEDARSDGVMVAWFPPPEIAQVLAIPGGEPAESLHMTLFYAGPVSDLSDLDVVRLIQAASDVPGVMLLPANGRIGGMGRFNASNSSSGKDVVYAVVDVPLLEHIRHHIVVACAGWGIKPASSHGFNPHITLAYIEPGADWPDRTPPAMPISIDSLTVCVGDRRVTFPALVRNADGRAIAALRTQTSAGIRTEIKDGRTYLVAPAITIVEGVLNEELVLEEEFGKFPGAWNGIPLVIGHPEADGVPISANRPEQTIFGRLYGVYTQDSRLHGEAWFDVAALKAAGKRGKGVLSRLQAGEVIELSTAYWRDIERVAGTFKGKGYKAIARNLRPDHLAILPDSVGACSVRNGCGVPRTNNVIGGGNMPATSNRLHGENAGSQEDNNVDLIKELTANDLCPLTAEELELLPEEALQRLAQQYNEMAENETGEDGGGADAGGGEALPELAARMEQLATRMDAIGASIDAITANLSAAAQEERDVLAAEIATYSGSLAAQELAGVDLETLRKLRAAFAPADYGGRGGSFTAHNAHPVEAPMPVMGQN